MAAAKNPDRLRRYWDRQARNYDNHMSFLDRKFFGDTRQWVCAQARGDTLEVAIGTGLNLPLYPTHVRLFGIDFSPGMLEFARQRAGETVDLRIGDAQALPFDDSSFDTVVCTFSLCAISDVEAAIAEMRRVLRPSGRLLLADHVVSDVRVVRLLQRAMETVSIPLGGEHFRRRPIDKVRKAGLTVQRHERFKLGIVERLLASEAPSAVPRSDPATDQPSA